MKHERLTQKEERLRREMYATADILVGMFDSGDRSQTALLEFIAKRAQLSRPTIRKLLSRQTRYPRHETIQKLASAAGLRITTDERGMKISLAR